MTTITNNPIRRTMSLLDEHKESLPEGVYLEMCDNLKKLYSVSYTHLTLPTTPYV